MANDRLHRRIRVALQSTGLLKLAYRLTTPHIRARVARRFGLSSFTAPLIREKPYAGQVRTDGINYVADLRADLGIGESARSICAAICAANIPVSYHEVAFPLVSRSHTMETAASDQVYGVTLAHLNPSELRLGVEKYPRTFRECYTIGYWLWEVPRFPQRWHGHMNALDEIWTSSHYTRDILAEISPIPVHTMPIPVVVNPADLTRRDFNLPEDRFIFFFAFNPGSSLARKNPYGLIEAYRRAFSGLPDPPLLVIKAHHLGAAEHRAIAKPLRKAVQEIGGVLIEDNLTRAQMHSLTKLADCVVSLHRAEGFGLLMAEAMALGTPVIATGYSGNMDFMTPENSFPVPYTLREITAEDHRHQPTMGDLYTPGQLWADPDYDYAADLMRSVVKSADDASRRARQAKLDLAQNGSPEMVGAQIAARLHALGLETAHPS
jgi:glycosyltransferase involved in cell wall biosynthesis